jgi:hypothetical protein
MAEISKSKGVSVKTLLTRSATRKNVIKELSKAATTLKSADILMLSYSGHGGQVPDRNKDEDDYQDETWCLYDGELIDDEIYKLLGRFASGVRILVFSDSCHSGTVTKAAFYQGTIASRSSAVSPEPVRYRFMPPEVALRTYRKNKKFYDSLQKDPALKKAEDLVKASVLLISGCQDNQYSSGRHVQRSFHRNAPAGLERWQIEYLPEILQGHRETHASGADTELLLGRNAQQEV